MSGPASSVHGIAPAGEWTAPPLPESLALRYRVKRKIGQGGMGAVYVAEDLAVGRLVVLKQLLMQDPEQVARLTREGQVLGALSHPRILKLYGVEVSEGVPVLVLELIEGVSLEATLEAFGTLEVDRALAVADMIADALDAVHAAGLIHRDLKPGNVLLTSEAGLKVLDFGLARPAERGADDAPLTQPGTYLGTPHYMAPELWRCEALDGRADLYALGVMLFEMIAGQLPFDADTPTAVAVKHLTEAPPSLLAPAPAAGAGVASLVNRLLAKDPAARPASAAALRAEIAILRSRDRSGTKHVVADAGSGSARRSVVADAGSGSAKRNVVADAGSGSARRDVVADAGSGSAKRNVVADAGSGSATRNVVADAGSGGASASRKGAPREPLTRPGSRPGARHTALVPASREPRMRQKFRPWVPVLGVVALLALLAAAALSRLAPGAPATTPIPRDLVVNLAGPRSVTLTFHTTVPSRWTLTTSARASVTETSEARVHTFTLAVPAWDAPDAMVLTCGARTVQVEPPAGPRARVRRLAVAVRAAKLDLTATDRVYEAIRPAFRGWNVMDPLTATAAHAARELAERPELAGPLMELLSRAAPAAEALAAVRTLVPEALTDPSTPPELQEELLDALARLDHVDALAGYYGHPAPFGIQALLRRVLDVRIRTLTTRRASTATLPSPVPVPSGACRLYAPPAHVEGLALFLPDEDVTKAGAGIAPVFMLQKVPGLVNVEPGSELRVTPCRPPGPRGHRLALTVRSLPPGLYLWLQCGRIAAGLPLRIEPPEDAGVNSDLELTARIPTALAPPGHAWTLTQRRLFRTASRIYFVVRAADLTPE